MLDRKGCVETPKGWGIQFTSGGWMSRFVLVLILFQVGEAAAAPVRWFERLRKHTAFSSEVLEIPESRRFRVPDSIEVDGDRSHFMFAPLVPRRIRFYWELETRNNLSILHKGIRDFRVQDLVIVLRALPDGRMFDALGQELPETFFEQISPNLRSLSLYTCFGDEVSRRYSLRETLSSGDSYHSERSLFISSQDCDDEGTEEPIEPDVDGFRTFMKQVERGIADQQKREWWLDEPTREDPGRALCALAIRAEKTEDIHLGFFLNGHFVGSREGISEGMDYLQYPCRFLVEGENRIEFRRTLSGTGPLPKIRLEPMIPGFQVTGQMRDGSFCFSLSAFARWFPLRDQLIFQSK